MSNTKSSRKRPYLQEAQLSTATDDSVPSSDPAYFSSDDIINASLDNYGSQACRAAKRVYRGSWWEGVEVKRQADNEERTEERKMVRKGQERGIGTVVTSDGTGEEKAEKSADTQKKKRQAEFKRNFDSGVWMGSDDSEEVDVEMKVHDDVVPLVQQGSSITSPATTEAVAQTCTQVRKAQHDGLSKEESLAHDRIWDCIEEGSPVIILSRLNLTSLTPEIIKALNLIVDTTTAKISTTPKEPIYEPSEPSHSIHHAQDNHRTLSAALRTMSSADDPPQADVRQDAAFKPINNAIYRRLTPRLELLLASNGLENLPPEIWSLHNLKSLDLWGNNLTKLPSAIGQLESLELLSVSRNKLRYLPWELIPLMCGASAILTSRDLDENDYERIWYPDSHLRKTWELQRSYAIRRRAKSRRFHNLGTRSRRVGGFWFITASPVIYLGWDGRPEPGSSFGTSFSEWADNLSESESPQNGGWTLWNLNEAQLQSAYADPFTRDFLFEVFKQRLPQRQLQKQQQQRQPSAASSRNVPSLFELSLRSLAYSCIELPESIDDPSSDTPLPSSIKSGLREVKQVRSEGGRVCSICRCRYLRPRSEWVELWCDNTYKWRASSRVTYYPFVRRCCGCVADIDPLALGNTYSDEIWHQAIEIHGE